MLKIKTRLEDNQDNIKEYIQLVGACMRKGSMDETQKFLTEFRKYIMLVMRKIQADGKRDLLIKMWEYYKDWRMKYSTLKYRFAFVSRDIWLHPVVMAWLVMPYGLIKEIHKYVKEVCTIHLGSDDRWENSYKQFSKKNVNNWIVEVTDNKVCPYCNLSFIYNRTVNNATAELDHFYNKKVYPLLALSFYNLIPACHACNQIKSDNDIEIMSPYDEHAYDDLKIDYSFSEEENVDFFDVENNIVLKFDGSAQNKKHLELMEIEAAYDNHKDYAAELIQKITIYNNNAARSLIQDSIDIAISTKEFEQVYFGKYRNQPSKRILGKMTKDFLEKYLEL